MKRSTSRNKKNRVSNGQKNIVFHNSVFFLRSDIFPDESFKPEEYIKNIPRSILLRYAILFINNFNHHSHIESSEDFLDKYFSEYKDKSYLIWKKILRDKSIKFNTKIVIVYPLSNFKFFEIASKQSEFEYKLDDIEYIEKSNINVLKCYLSINEIFASKEAICRMSLEKWWPNDISLLTSFLGSLMESDITKFSPIFNYIAQYTKSKYLFSYLLSTPNTRELLKEYLMERGLNSVSDYLGKLVFIFDQTANRDKIVGLALFTIDPIKFPKLYKFVNMFLLTKITDDDDFLSIRNSPIIELEPNVFHLIHDKFLFDKLYIGIFFDLFKIYKERKMTMLNDFMGHFGEHFFERYLASKVLYDIILNKAIKLSGEDIKSARLKSELKGEPDYYIRDWQNIYVFEVKNNLIKNSIKYSFNYEKVEPYLKTRFIYDEENKKDGVIRQIINNIDLIFSNKLDFDQINSCNSIKIYPIAIVPEESYSSYGFNYIVNQWFEQELESRSNGNRLRYRRVRPLVIITIDTIIILRYYIKMKRLKLKDLLDTYIGNYLTKQEYNKNRISFTMFVNNFIVGSGLPPIDFKHSQDEIFPDFDFRFDV
ncbi:hypothetical protein DYBT9275_03066 [Dyadobacter sp. CECT 9275]|uniref:Uncharacterized protein n=1 Tax=Dyadobacter helix TaxID=2822344 RepID=A0A916N6E3_9BACT|nr:hypothetical protein [Dyadobacter sp. CECT 9275]CAG5003131.1 hypothetical protein DYBT9275_03066 [Dyadobacter sp. CECT 9275]